MATSEIIEKANCRVALKVEVPREEVKAEFDKAYKGLIKNASVPGFRKGKAPLGIIKTRYREHVKEEVMRQLISSSFSDAIKEKNLEIVTEPSVEEVDLKEEEPFSYKASFEVRPEIKLGDYNKLKLTRKIKEITQEDIDRNLKGIQERLAQLKTVKGEVKEKHLNPIDDELAKDVGFDSLEKLKQDIQKRFEWMEEQKAHQQLIMQIDKELLNIGDLVPPESLVKNKEEVLLKDLERSMEEEGKKDEYKTKEEELRKDMHEASVKRIKVTYLIDEIGKRENIQASEQDVEESLKKMFGDNNEELRKTREKMTKENMWRNYILMERERKIYQYLIDKAEIQKS